jgi:hypothetical protein
LGFLASFRESLTNLFQTVRQGVRDVATQLKYQVTLAFSDFMDDKWVEAHVGDAMRKIDKEFQELMDQVRQASDTPADGAESATNRPPPSPAKPADGSDSSPSGPPADDGDGSPGSTDGSATS